MSPPLDSSPKYMTVTCFQVWTGTAWCDCDEGEYESYLGRKRKKVQPLDSEEEAPWEETQGTRASETERE